MSGAARQRRRRDRERDGRVVWPIEVDDDATVAALIAAGFLTEDEARDRRACAMALARVVRIWTEEIQKP